MWYEGHVQEFQEISEETRNFFLANRDIKPVYTGVDDDSIWEEAQDDLDHILGKFKFSLLNLVGNSFF